MKKYRYSIVCLIITLLCILLYSLIGSKVLQDGTLEEPFFLIPIGYLFLFIAIISAVFVKLKNNKKA